MESIDNFIINFIEQVNNNELNTLVQNFHSFEDELNYGDKIKLRKQLKIELLSKKSAVISNYLKEDEALRVYNFNGDELLIRERFDQIINYLGTLPEDKSKSSSSKKQGTASQIALAFVIMMEENHFPQGIDQNTKQARFLEFLTGIGSEGLRKKIGTYKKLESLYLAEKKELESLKKDLEVVLEEFKNLNLLEESKKVKTAIGYIKAQIADFKDNLEK